MKKELMKDKDFKKEWNNKYDLAFEISKMIIRERIKQGMTQEELAEKIGTKQESIARLENSVNLPSLKFLKRVAEGFGKKLMPPKFK